MRRGVFKAARKPRFPLVEEVGVEADPNEESMVSSTEEKEIAELTNPITPANYSSMSVAELQVHLKAALDNEDYELAARIRDELNKKKQS